MEFDLKFLLELKIHLELKLSLVGVKIDTFPVDGNDEEFDKLVKYAIYLRNQLKNISTEIEKL